MPQESPSVVTVMGLFRSGTNFLRAALEWNCHCTVRYDTFGWKHGMIPVGEASRAAARDATDLIVVTKDPFASMHSIYRYFRDSGLNIRASKSWPAFLRSRIVIFDQSNPASPEYRFQNPVQLWNDVNWNLHHFRAEGFKTPHVRYGDLLVDPQATLQGLVSRLRLERKTAGTFELPEKKLRRMDESARTDRGDYVTHETFDAARYYRDAEYMQHYDADDLAFVLDQVDESLVQDLGYDAAIERARALVPGAKRRRRWWRP